MEGMTLDKAIEILDHLKGELLFSCEETEAPTPMAEQFMLLALASMEQTHAYLKLAKYHSMQGR